MKDCTTGNAGAAVAAASLLMLCLAGCGAGNGSGGDDRAVAPASGDFRAIVTVTIEHPDRDPFSYAIACEGDRAELQGAADTDPVAACAALQSPDVQARLFDGPPADRMCTEIYGGPDTAKGHGNINGRRFEFAVDRTDGCAIADWDRLLGDILVNPRPVTR